MNPKGMLQLHLEATLELYQEVTLFFDQETM